MQILKYNLTKKKKNRMFHLASVLVCIGYMTFILARKNLGKNIFGTCSTKAVSTSIVFGPFIVIFYSIIALIAILYFNKYVPDE